VRSGTPAPVPESEWLTACPQKRPADLADCTLAAGHVSPHAFAAPADGVGSGEPTEQAREHLLKVVPPYFDSLVAGSKTFEVRRNDRAYQRGDVLRLREWHPHYTNSVHRCPEPGCGVWDSKSGHWAEAGEVVLRRVTFVFAGDPRFGGLEPGYVILGLGNV
jgi:hypothetical protein